MVEALLLRALVGRRLAVGNHATLPVLGQDVAFHVLRVEAPGEAGGPPPPVTLDWRVQLFGPGETAELRYSSASSMGALASDDAVGRAALAGCLSAGVRFADLGGLRTQVRTE